MSQDGRGPRGGLLLIAALPWYDFEEVRHLDDALWTRWRQALRAERVVAPEGLTRGRSWRSLVADELLLVTQLCGWVVPELPPRIEVVGVPAWEGYRQATYRSVVVRSGPGERVVINAWDSHSGCNALREFGVAVQDAQVSGSHVRSLEILACGEADIAAIDRATWCRLETYRPELLQGLDRLGETGPAPAPPLVTGRPDLVEVLRRTFPARLFAADRAPYLDRFGSFYPPSCTPSPPPLTQ